MKLKLIPEKSVFTGSQDANYVIHGDNIEVMNYFNEYKDTILPINCMIWDPPYNTGRRDLNYNDDRANWSSFMSDRLCIARDILKDSGNIAVHINYKNIFTLANIMDWVFGEKNRKGIINWECSLSLKNASQSICSNTDYILIYAKNKKKSFTGLLPRTEAMIARYNKSDSGGQFKSDKATGVYAVIDLSGAQATKDNRYGIQNPITKKIYYPSQGRGWRRSQAFSLEELGKWGPCEIIDNCIIFTGEVNEAASTSYIVFGNTNLTGPRLKQYFHELKRNGRVVGSFWKPADTDDIDINLSLTLDISGHNGEAKHAYSQLMNSELFMTPKPLKITKTLLEVLCPSNGLVLDAFAGSGTVGHAVLETNATQQASRNFVLIENEDYCDNICAERLRRVSKILDHQCCHFNYYELDKEPS